MSLSAWGQQFRATGSVAKRYRRECRQGGVGGEKYHK